MIFLRKSIRPLREVIHGLERGESSLIEETSRIVGIYGMNFKFMPELGWRRSYLIVWAIIVVIVVFMVIYFKKKVAVGEFIDR